MAKNMMMWSLKKMDCFLGLENLVVNNFLIKSWVETIGQSDHLPILFKIEKEDRKPMTPLKFKHMWLLEDNYKKLIEDAWKPLHPCSSMSYMQQMVDSNGWQHIKGQSGDKDVAKIVQENFQA